MDTIQRELILKKYNMTAPKEKAIQLVARYDDALTYLESKAKAKQCALIAVQELRDQCYDYRDIDLGASFDYWTDVLTELNKE